MVGGRGGTAGRAFLVVLMLAAAAWAAGKPEKPGKPEEPRTVEKAEQLQKADEPIPPAPTYEGFYTGAVMPTPQKVTYGDQFWPVVEGKEARAAIVLGPKPAEAERLGAEEIARRVAFLSGGVALPVVSAGQEGAAKVLILLGRPKSNPQIAPLLGGDAPKVPDHDEAYLIHAVEKDGRAHVVCCGRDEAGAYFSAQTLVQLFRKQGEAVQLQRVEIEDWPVYKVRSFKTGGAWSPGGGGLSGSEEMGLWAPFAKFNCYNICYTTLGADKWVAPEEGYVGYVRRMTRYQRARGLDCMPFVNPYYLWKAHIQVSEPKALAALAKTCRIGLDAGGSKVMLCLDDFASQPDFDGKKLYSVFNEADRKQFGDDLAKVDAQMINELHRQLREAFPNCTLMVVLPYYWTPGGAWQAEGERYLRSVGRALPEDVVIVWTGPRVRSTRLAAADVQSYQDLVGRKCFLWDNTMYARHDPPHFFLDDFVTRYPDKFWDLSWGGVHLNAGAGEAYKIGLLAVSDYLWHPDGYDPARAMRQATAALAGPEQVETLLEFRDAFYAAYDSYGRVWGTPQQMRDRIKDLKARPLDEGDVKAVTEQIAKLADAAEKIATGCSNKGLAAEVEERARQYDGYLEAFKQLEQLPPAAEADPATLVSNGGAERADHGKPLGWSTYTGAGQCAVSSVEGGHGGKRAIQFATTGWHDWGGGEKSINCALIAGASNGFTGGRAPEVQPFTKYHFSFWLKGDWPGVEVSFVGWAGDGSNSSQRVTCPAQPGSFKPTGEWQRCQGWFVTGTNVERGVLKIGISKLEREGAKLGTIWVDDLYVGLSSAPPETITEEPPKKKERPPKGPGPPQEPGPKKQLPPDLTNPADSRSAPPPPLPPFAQPPKK